MKKPFITSVTLFKSLFKTKDTAYILPIEDVYLRIKEGIGGTKELIEQIRSITDKEERNDKKKQLKAILFAGEFNQRNDNKIIMLNGAKCYLVQYLRIIITSFKNLFIVSFRFCESSSS